MGNLIPVVREYTALIFRGQKAIGEPLKMRTLHYHRLSGCSYLFMQKFSAVPLQNLQN
jgi:hypothetical protein